MTQMVRQAHHKEIIIDAPEEKKARAELETRTDAEAARMKRFLAMPDLSRTPGHPLYDIVQKALQAKSLDGLDIIKIPEIVPAHITFDLFNMPPGHPARSKSDTYYVNDEAILRTHDTVFWYYYLTLPEIQEKIKKGESFGAICYGKVYRKDEIDNRHMNVFHQFGGAWFAPMQGADKEKIGLQWQEELKRVLTDISHHLFGADVKNRFNKDTFPYTDPSMEMEIEKDGKWLEMLGCGVPRESVLKNFGVENYTGWAFGFGLERLAIVSMALPDIRLLWSQDERVKKQLKLGTIYKEVSKYPPITRDISFVVTTDFVPNNYFDLIRDIGGDLVEEVTLLDKYENEKKFGADKMSYAYRIVYRSTDRTLKSEEIEPLHKKIEEETRKQFGAEIR
jgi:phenylalanyl-tRNA synthetase alpha chain